MAATWVRRSPTLGCAALACAILASATTSWAQETRSAIFGTARDTSGGVLPGMTVVVTNEETNVSNEAATNERGYFELPYLLPGTYRIAVQAQGFKGFIRTGLELSVDTRAEVPVVMEVGAVVDEVTVVAETPMLDSTASASTTLTNRQINALPVFGNSAQLLVRSVPGIQWTGQPNYLGLHSNVGASGVNAAGGVGGTEYSLDGVPNTGNSRRVAYLPYTDTVEEIKVETASFDASKGHSSGANVSMLTKSGTNQFHGSGTWQYWNQQWNATQSTTNAAYYGRIAEAEGRGDTDAARRYRSEPKVPPGYSHNWATVVGGPVRVVKFDGRGRLFFFFSYNGFKDVKVEEPTAVNRTVPTERQRTGDFSELLALDPVRYQIYDPRTARLVNGRVVRDPFPNNQVPILNPLYQHYLKFYPLPNNPAGIVGREGQNNYLASQTPFNWDYQAFSNRIDWNASARHRLFARWSWNDFVEDRADWTYATARGLHSNGLNRRNIGATVDHVWLQNGSTIWNVSVAYNRFREGNRRNEVQRSFKPSSVGLPTYMDDRAGDCTQLPRLDFSDGSYQDFGFDCGGFTSYAAGTVRGELLKILGTHSLRAGADLRRHWRWNIPGGNRAGNFTFRNNYVRERDDTSTAGTLGLEWAGFMLGVPTGISIDSNDSYDLVNAYYAGYVQDDWHVSSRLTINVGVRYEVEDGFVEQQNRMLANFDAAATLPITAAAQAAYAANPVPGQSTIDVRGGALYAGRSGTPRAQSRTNYDWMPRVGVVYKLGARAAVRGGYGVFYDTNNVLNESINQFGFSRGTSTVITNDNGLTLLNTDLPRGRTIFTDPFPVREDGTRFNEPFGAALALMARAGRNFDINSSDWRRARQQRWRVGIQRQFGSRMVAEAAYLGSYTDRLSIRQVLTALPGQYWADGNVRNNAVADYLNGTVTNPFNIRNFEFLRADNPVLYQDMASNGFFTSTTIRRHQLLRPFPHMATGDGLRNDRVPEGRSRYHHLELSLRQRPWHGIEYTVGYTRAWDRRRDFYFNEFDVEPSWRVSEASLPHHLVTTAIVELPFGDGRRWLSEKGLARMLAGGWQVSAIYHLQSGRVINWDTNLFYYGADLESIELSGDERDRARWFNTDLFERSSSAVPGNFHRRTFPTRIDFLRGDYMNQLDLSVARAFKLTSSTRFELQLQAINALNRVQWDRPGTNPVSSNFGVVTQQWNTPRWIQLQGRFTF
jgi:hypothetical protein